jgi:TolA-binding protein
MSVLDEVRRREPGSDLSEKALLHRAMILGPHRIEQALGAFDAYLEAYPEGQFVADAMTEKGIAAYRLGLFDLAIREFVAVEREFPDHPRVEQAFCLRGWAHYLKGEDREARLIGDAFLETFPDSRFEPDVRMWLAEMAYNRGEYGMAAEEFQRLVEGEYATPLQARAAYLAGRSFLSAQDVAQALTSFETSYELNPSSSFAPEVLFYMGDALTELDRFDEAIVHFTEVVRDHPGSYLAAPALGRIGDCQYTLGERNPERYVEALNTYRQVKESVKAPLELQLQATYKTGRTLAALGREEDAISLFLEASATYRTHSTSLPSTASLWFVRSVTDAAQFYESRGQYREAIKIYRQLASTSLEGAAEAARRIEDLRREHLILF